MEPTFYPINNSIEGTIIPKATAINEKMYKKDKISSFIPQQKVRRLRTETIKTFSVSCLEEEPRI